MSAHSTTTNLKLLQNEAHECITFSSEPVTFYPDSPSVTAKSDDLKQRISDSYSFRNVLECDETHISAHNPKDEGLLCDRDYLTK